MPSSTKAILSEINTIKNSCEVIEFEFHSSFIISAAGHNFSGATEVEFLDGV